MPHSPVDPKKLRCVGLCSGDWHSYQCTRDAVVMREEATLTGWVDKPYCKQHDPVRVKERRDARNAQWDKELDSHLSAENEKAENQIVGAWIREHAGYTTDAPRPFAAYLKYACEKVKEDAKKTNVDKS